ncbi:MAG: hypothetical protein R3236_00150 [Phycisphaeraceae bacterium]|nr:hypothetical protein [Phycisphaeraceae bacterium]
MAPTTAPNRTDIAAMVGSALESTPIVDLHTHLYPPSFGPLMSWGIDDLLTYHYLIAELMRVIEPSDPDIDGFYAMPKQAQADLIWQRLFLDRSPISEACRGVATTLNKLGLDTQQPDLNAYRAWFAEQTPEAHLERVLEVAGVERVTMTNDPFDETERKIWLDGVSVDARFDAVLRIDPLIVDWAGGAVSKLNAWGFDVDAEASGRSIEQVQRFLNEWLDRMQAVYVAASLPPSFAFPSKDPGVRVLTEAVLPVCAERNLPMAMMIGVDRAIHPALRQAGDMGFTADIRAVTNLCAAHPDNKFMVTMLSETNQHELAVAARKFGNLMVFGCWWFLNNPSLIERISRFRTELLGLSYIPQHSDCRVTEQLIYKWDHSLRVLRGVLTDKYADLAATGWPVDEAAVGRDVRRLLKDNYLCFLDR